MVKEWGRYGAFGLMECSIQFYNVSNFTIGAWYVTLQIKLNEEKSKHAWFVSAKWFWPSIFAVC
jgi:hypothetical protein